MTETETTQPKQTRGGRVIGLAFSERTILAAEVSGAGGQLEVTHAAAFAVPEGMGFAEPDALGRALGQFLKENGFTARTAVLGIPAKWVLSRPKEVPPADAETIADSLRLQAEGDFSSELKDLVFDYAGDPATSGNRTVLLMAVPHRYVEQVSAVARAAKLKPAVVTPVAAAIGAATGRVTKNASVLSLSPGGAEFTAQRGANPLVMRHLGASTASVPMLLAELRRLAVMVPPGGGVNGANGATLGSNGTNGSNGANGRSGREMIFWDDVGLTDPARRAVSDALGASFEAGTLESLGVSNRFAGEPGRAHAVAVALALVGLSEDRPPVDFLHSRLAPPKPKGLLQRRTVLAAAAAFAVLALIVVAIVDQQRKQHEVDTIKAELKGKATQVTAAEAEVKRVSYAEAWHAGAPRYLACLRDLTMAVPDDQQMFLTSFTLHDNMRGVFSGKSTTDRNVLSLLDRLKETKRFLEIEPALDTRDAGRSGREVMFSMKFRYVPKDEPEPVLPQTRPADARGGGRGNDSRGGGPGDSRGGSNTNGSSEGRGSSRRR